MTGEELVGFWPLALLDERPKNLFVDYSISSEQCEGVKCLLEGIRVGSISPDKEKMRWLELEAKVYGLLTGKDKLSGKAPKVDQEVLDNLLDFGKKQAKIR